MDVPGFAMVTGAASGIGKACATALVRDGAAGVALLDVNHENLVKVKAEIEEMRKKWGREECRLEVFTIDVAKEEQVEDVVQAVARTFGRLDYVINAAGIAMKHEGGAAFCKTGDWQRIMDINLNGSFYILRAASRIMLKQDPILSSIDGRSLSRGSIVLFGSIQSVVGLPTSTAYTVTKHGVMGLVRTASEDYAKDGLRINAICPGYTETPLTTASPLILKTMQEKVANAVPMARMGKPSEIADGVIYLAGGRSSFVTGSALFVDGGYTQR